MSDLIHHYWSRKQLFRAKTKAWYDKHRAAPVCQYALDETRQVTAVLPRPPTLQRLAYKVITVALPGHKRQFMREILYGCYPHPNPFDRACGPVWWEKALENVEHRLKNPCRIMSSNSGSAIPSYDACWASAAKPSIDT